MAIFKWLDDYEDLITSYIIHDLRESEEMHYIHVEVHFQDSSQLFIKEFKQPGRRKYAFHWQKNSGELIVRWDNAPHFSNLSNFPITNIFQICRLKEATIFPSTKSFNTSQIAFINRRYSP